MTTDICERKHCGAATSVEAFDKVEPTLRMVHQEILGLMIHLTNGLTAKEYAGITGKGLNAVSGRFSELKKANKIKITGDKREGCAVWEVSK
jgi:hypothetical protein